VRGGEVTLTLDEYQKSSFAGKGELNLWVGIPPPLPDTPRLNTQYAIIYTTPYYLYCDQFLAANFTDPLHTVVFIHTLWMDHTTISKYSQISRSFVCY